MKESTDQNNSVIAAKFGVSPELVRVLYNYAARKRKNLYFDAVCQYAEMERKPLEVLKKQLEYEYEGDVYVCAYLELEYEKPLTELRGGEPGIPQHYKNRLPRLRGVDVPLNRYYIADGTPRLEYSEEEKMVVALRKKHKTIYHIAYLLGCTDDKVQRIFRDALIIKGHQQLDFIASHTGQTVDQIHTSLETKYPKIHPAHMSGYITKEYGGIVMQMDDDTLAE